MSSNDGVSIGFGRPTAVPIIEASLVVSAPVRFSAVIREPSRCRGQRARIGCPFRNGACLATVEPERCDDLGVAVVFEHEHDHAGDPRGAPNALPHAVDACGVRNPDRGWAPGVVEFDGCVVSRALSTTGGDRCSRRSRISPCAG
jgi:hypothetical protein